MIVKFFILQLLAHLVSDFYLQTENSCKSKADNAFKSRHLYIHSAITFACAWLLSMSWGFWWAALMIAVSHLIIDGLKSVCKNIKGAFFFDQLLHLAVIVAAVCLYPGPEALRQLPLHRRIRRETHLELLLPQPRPHHVLQRAPLLVKGRLVAE